MSIAVKRGSSIVLASHNAGKLKELETLVAPFDITVHSSKALDLSEPMEDGDTFEQNALIKARAACNESQMIAIADDSGLMVEALDGAPGVQSARWAAQAGGFAAANQKLIELLKNSQSRKAAFVSVIALVLPTGEEYIFRGEAEGNIALEIQGSNGFGYDPVFIPLGETRSFGNMRPEEKAQYSHRSKAFAQMLTLFQ